MEPTYRKSWAGSLLIWSNLILGHSFKVKLGQINIISTYSSDIIGPRGLQCETNLQQIMDQESTDVVRFDLGPQLQGETRITKFKCL